MSKYKTDYSEFDEKEYDYDEENDLNNNNEEEAEWNFTDESEADDDATLEGDLTNFDLLTEEDNEEEDSTIIRSSQLTNSYDDDDEEDEDNVFELDDSDEDFEFTELDDDDEEYDDDFDDIEENDNIDIADIPIKNNHPQKDNSSNLNLKNSNQQVSTDDTAHTDNTAHTDDDSEKKEITSFKDLWESMFSNFKTTKSSIDLSKFFDAYDPIIEKLAGGIAKIPLLGKIVNPFRSSKTAFRLFPLIFIILILGILISISYILGPGKNSKIPLPDMGEITVESINYNKENNAMNVIMTNTGGVLLPVDTKLSLYSYNPSLNPLSLTKFEEVGTCYITDVLVDTETPLEDEIPCKITDGKEVKYRVTASYKEPEED